VRLFDLISRARLHGFLTDLSRHTGAALAILDPRREVLLATKAYRSPPSRGGRPAGVAHPLRVKGTLIGYLTYSEPGQGRRAAGRGRPDLGGLTSRCLVECLERGAEVENLALELTRAYEELVVLHRLSSQLGQEIDRGRICQIVGTEVMKLLPVDYCSMMLVDDERRELSVWWARYRGVHVVSPHHLRLAQVSALFADDQPTLVEDLRNHPLQKLVPPGLSALLAAPLVVANSACGILGVGEKRDSVAFTAPEITLLAAVGGAAAIAIDNARLHLRVRSLFLGTIEALVSAINAKDPYAASHSTRVARIARLIGEELDLPTTFLEDLELAGLLHDIGKIATSDKILGKPGQLTPEEWVTMRQHPLHSARILAQIKGLEEITYWVKHEHEWYNGQGYPEGLVHEQIPLASRIIAVADTYDALTTDRVYRKAISPERAIPIITDASGTQFDPAAVAAFLTAHHKGRMAGVCIPPATGP